MIWKRRGKFDKFYESSAKNGFNVQKIFIEAANILYDEYIDYKSVISHNTSSMSDFSENKNLNKKNKLNDGVKAKKKKCC